MILNKQNWNKNDYRDFVKYLKTLGNKDYIIFTKKIVPLEYKMIGIKIPILREISKKIMLGNYLKFLEVVENNFFEEKLIEGFVISKIPDINIFNNYLNSYILKIDNWSICDSFCNSLKIIGKHLEEYYNYIVDKLHGDNDFIVRFGLVVLLCYYINDNYIDKVLDEVRKITNNSYYVSMALAWLLCEAYIKYPNKIDNYLFDSGFSLSIIQKTIRKINDSYRVSDDKKEKLNVKLLAFKGVK